MIKKTIKLIYTYILFKYLKIKYDFNPPYFTSDFQIGQINAILSIFPNAKLILC